MQSSTMWDKPKHSIAFRAILSNQHANINIICSNCWQLVHVWFPVRHHCWYFPGFKSTWQVFCLLLKRFCLICFVFLFPPSPMGLCRFGFLLRFPIKATAPLCRLTLSDFSSGLSPCMPFSFCTMIWLMTLDTCLRKKQTVKENW